MINSKRSQVNICYAYLHHLFNKLPNTLTSTSLAATQGDIYYQSMSMLLERMQLSSDDVFIDLGSGIGKIVFQAFLLSHAKKCIGIEMEHSLHHIALEKYSTIIKEVPLFFNDNRQIQLIHGDFLEKNFNEVTVIFVSAVCFSQSTLHLLAKKLNQLPHLRSIFSLKPLTYLDILPFKRTFYVQCSWGLSLCYWYDK